MRRFVETNFVALWLLSLVLLPFWAMALLMLNAENAELQTSLRWAWLALTATPIVGLISLRSIKWRFAWSAMLLLMLIFLVMVIAFSQQLGLYYDGP